MGSETQAAVSKLPTIDISITPGSNSWPSSAADQVRRALETYGCFLAKYDKISPEMHHRMFEVGKDLFGLPTEIKVKNTSGILGFGYGTKFSSMPLLEYFGIECATTLEAAREFTNLMWPAGNDHFCETAYEYSMMLSELNKEVMRMVFGSYGVDKHCDPLLDSAFYMMRMLKYRTPEEDEINVGLNPHVDKNFLGVLDTDQVTGLEIQTRDGEWIAYEPSPAPSSTFLVIAGEPFQAWSNGRIFAPLHRVVIRGSEERYSIAQFSFMRHNIRVPDELVDEENPLKFKEFNHMDFLEFVRGHYKLERVITPFCGIN